MIPCLYTFRDLQLSFVVPLHQSRCETEPWDGSRKIDCVVVHFTHSNLVKNKISRGFQMTVIK